VDYCRRRFQGPSEKNQLAEKLEEERGVWHSSLYKRSRKAIRAGKTPEKACKEEFSIPWERGRKDSEERTWTIAATGRKEIKVEGSDDLIEMLLRRTRGRAPREGRHFSAAGKGISGEIPGGPWNNWATKREEIC